MEMNEKTEKDLSKRLKQGDYQALKAISESYFAERPERLFSNEQYEEKGIYININKGKNKIDYLKIAGDYKNETPPLGEMPETLNDLENLKYLYLPRNNIEEIKNIGNLEYLKVLNLTKNKIKNLENLEKLPALRIINISSNPIDYENNGNIETLNTLEDNGVKIISDPVSGPMNTWV